MEKSIDVIRKTRAVLFSVIEGLSVEELNKVPPNFNNNIAWNLAHVVASQQVLCYKLSGNSFKIDEEFIKGYSKGTKPEKDLTQDDIDFIKDQAASLINEMEKDLEQNIFNDYTPYPTSFGVELTNIQDALTYVAMHEGLHLGYVMALKRVIKNK